MQSVIQPLAGSPDHPITLEIKNSETGRWLSAVIRISCPWITRQDSGHALKKYFVQASLDDEQIDISGDAIAAQPAHQAGVGPWQIGGARAEPPRNCSYNYVNLVLWDI